ncbi:uncharacterized protein BDR25DRAFT_354484 [Lindgomyces ingoldianus]|uniref:Uncharacterized protein n=1 Tax=Lindgomyces ingoldianus TaxID=673940 RepID=A0ACB6QW32_9PLEO|nr:uncharacterized protein BDR25DRAFT_354484 [Lindgomyces ingoldianus]KAF2471228.1 hypothetical protein BDR25DRAFT_354484 [Lindgomyces ingoldianus]
MSMHPALDNPQVFLEDQHLCMARNLIYNRMHQVRERFCGRLSFDLHQQTWQSIHMDIGVRTYPTFHDPQHILNKKLGKFVCVCAEDILDNGLRRCAVICAEVCLLSRPPLPLRQCKCRPIHNTELLVFISARSGPNTRIQGQISAELKVQHGSATHRFWQLVCAKPHAAFTCPFILCGWRLKLQPLMNAQKLLSTPQSAKAGTCQDKALDLCNTFLHLHNLNNLNPTLKVKNFSQ